MKNCLLRALLTSILLLLSTSNATARTYVVEMIAFTNEGESAERWNFNSEQSTARRSKVNAIYTRSRNVSSNNRLSYLNNVYSALAGSAEHHILTARKWTQKSASYARSPLVKISNEDLSIKGGIRVYAPNLLFAELNLMYAPNGDSLAITAAHAREAYFIDERRRMKLKEAHYFDHSKFGVVLIVVPL